MAKTGKIFIFCLVLAITAGAMGQTPNGINFQGVVAAPNGNYPTVTGATVNLKVLAPNGCILRDENFTGVNIINGYINLVVGAGSPSG